MGKVSAGFVTIALSRDVVVTSLKVSLVVGTLLALINHGAALMQLALNGESIMQITLTYLVPYCVAAYSSVKAIGSGATPDNR